MQHYNHNSYEQSHPLQSDYDSSSARYPSQQQHNSSQYQQQEQGYQRDDHDYNQGYDHSNSNGNNQLSNLHQASPLQLDQLQAQRQYSQQQQHYSDADETLKQQHRVARTSDNKAANYHLYPPQPNGSSSSIDMQDGSSLKNSFSTLFRFPCSTKGKALILVIGLEALLVIIIQTIIVAKYFDALRDTPIEPRIGQKKMPPYLDSGNASRAIPAYLIVFVFAQLFQLVLAWDAVSLDCRYVSTTLSASSPFSPLFPT